MMKLINNKEIVLRKLKQTDKTLLQKWLTDKRVLNYWEGQSAIFDPERIKSDFYTKKEGLTRAIIEHNGKAIGYCQMYPLDKESQKEYNYQSSKDIVYGVDQFIGEPDYWGQGIGTAFMKLLLDYLINIKNAETVILDPHTDNLRAIRCYEKAGFKIIKLLPKHEMHDNIMVDCYLMEYSK